jgi:hypothetical protein
MTVFHDYDGCNALICATGSVKAAFCAICLEDCGRDAHAHVRENHGSLFDKVAFKIKNKSHRARVVVGRVLSVRGGTLPRHLFRFEFRIQKFTARTGGYRSLASTVPLFDSIHSSLYHVIFKEASL